MKPRFGRLSGRQIMLAATLFNALVFLRVAVINSPYLSYLGPTGFDRVYYYVYTRSLAIDHDIDFTNDLALHPPSERVALGRDGRPVNKYPIGTGLIALPAFWVTHEVIRMFDAVGFRIAANGFSPPYVIGYALSEMAAAVLGMWLLYRVCSRYFPDRTAALGVVLAWCGTNALHFTAVDVMLSHAAAEFSTAWCAYEAITLRDRPDRRMQWCRAGISSAFVVLVRNQNAVFLLVPGVVGLTLLWRALKAGVAGPTVRSVGVAIASFFAACVPQLLVWRQMYGAVVVNSYRTEFSFTWQDPKLLGVLTQSERGLFLWAPVLAVGLVGALVVGIRRRDSFVLAGLGAWALNFYVICSWWGWQNLSRRATFDIMFPVAFGLSAALAALDRRWPVLTWGLTFAAIAWSLPFAAMGVPRGTDAHVWLGWFQALRQLV